MPCAITLRLVKHHPVHDWTPSRASGLACLLHILLVSLTGLLIMAEAFGPSNENTHVTFCEIRGSNLRDVCFLHSLPE
jgi:hypothetical protein